MNIYFYLRSKLFSSLQFIIRLYVYIIRQQDTKDGLDPQIIIIILSGMSEVVELVRDNLNEYISDDELLVVFGTPYCHKCLELKPYLYELPDILTVVIVNCERHIKSMKYMPGGIERYPTIGLYNKGYFIKEVDTNLILTKQFK